MEDPIEQILSPGALDKPLSTLYGALLCTNSAKLEKLWEYWQVDVLSLDRQSWEEGLEQAPKLVISSRDKLTQVKYLHRVYYTPKRLQRMFPQCDPQLPPL